MTLLSFLIIVVLFGLLILLASRGPQVWVSFTFISLLAVIGLYIFDLFRMPQRVRWYFIDPVDHEYLLLISLAFIICFGFGEKIGLGIGGRRLAVARPPEDPAKWAKIAIALALVALVGQSIFVISSGGFAQLYSSAHGSAGNFSTAYIYRLLHSGFTAGVILFVLHLRGENLSKPARIMMYVIIAFLVFDAFIQGKRGGVIRVALLFLVPMFISGMLTKRRLVLAAIGGVLAIGFVVILPDIRHALALGSWSELGSAVGGLGASDYEQFDGVVRLEGKHVVFATIVVSGAMENPAPNYGARWLFPIINLIPRSIWPDKPLRYEFASDFFDVSQQTSYIQISDGSYPGGIAESFVEWGWLVLAVWFVMGLVLGYARGTAMTRKTIFSITMFFALAVFHLHFMLQDTIQGAFSLMFLTGPFLVILGLVKLLGRSRTLPQPPRRSSSLPGPRGNRSAGLGLPG